VLEAWLVGALEVFFDGGEAAWGGREGGREGGSVGMTSTSKQGQTQKGGREGGREGGKEETTYVPSTGSRVAAEKCQQLAKPVTANLVNHLPSCPTPCCITLIRP
jgi:hypothetical protein